MAAARDIGIGAGTLATRGTDAVALWLAVGAAADASVAFEDSRSGVRSASSAGIQTIGMRTSLSHDDMVGAGAVMSAKDFDDPKLLEFVAVIMNW